MTLFFKWVFLAISFFLQTSLVSNFNIFGVVSSFFFAALLFAVSEENMKNTIIFGTVFGVITDLLFMKIFGIYTALYLLISIAASFLGSRMREKKLLYYLILTFFFSILIEYLLASLLVGSSVNVTLGYVFLHKVLPTALLNSVWMLILYGISFQIRKKGWKKA